MERCVHTTVFVGWMVGITTYYLYSNHTLILHLEPNSTKERVIEYTVDCEISLPIIYFDFLTTTYPLS